MADAEKEWPSTSVVLPIRSIWRVEESQATGVIYCKNESSPFGVGHVRQGQEHSMRELPHEHRTSLEIAIYYFYD